MWNFPILIICLAFAVFGSWMERGAENLINVVSAKIEDIVPRYETVTEHAGFSIDLDGDVTDHYRKARYFKCNDVRFYVEYSDKKPRHVWVEEYSDDYYELMKYVKDN